MNEDEYKRGYGVLDQYHSGRLRSFLLAYENTTDEGLQEWLRAARDILAEREAQS